MSALALARERHDRTRQRMEEAAAALFAGDLGGVERLCEAALQELTDSWPTFAPDEAALCDVLAMLAVTGAWCRSHRKRRPEGLVRLLDTATALRLSWLEGEENEAA